MSLRIIAGELRGRRIEAPPGNVTRPMSDLARESLFNILASDVEGRVAFDLFAGSGALGIEALSRGASRAVFVEQDSRVAATIRRNLATLGLTDCAAVVKADVFRWAPRYADWPREPCLVLIAPPYALFQQAGEKIARLLEDLVQWLAPGSIQAVQSERRKGEKTQVLPQEERWDVRRYGRTQLALLTLPGVEASPSASSSGSDAGETLVLLRPDDPKQQFARDVARRLRAAGFQALWAGGCVRDLLLGKAPDDYDVATDARPGQVQDLFGRRRTVAVGASFGVILVLGPPEAGDVEVATFRTEGPYSDGRRPDHVVYSTPEDDSGRRDFTINGMFCDPFTGEVLDFVGGRRDLHARVLRAIGDPEARFSEDKLRLLRAVRFAATLAFQVEPATQAALQSMAGQIECVSAERITGELRRMLVHENRAAALQLAYETGVLRAILPELLPMVGLAQGKPVQPDGDLWQHTLLVLDKLPRPEFPLALAALLHDVGKPATQREENGVLTFHGHEHVGYRMAADIGTRLRLSNKELELVVWLVEHHMYLSHAREMRWAKLKRILVHPAIDDLLELHRADALATDGDLSQVEYCRQLLHELPEEELNPPRLLTGHDLIRRGVPQGPVYHQVLEAVRDAQLEGRVRSKKKALALVDELLARKGADESAG